MQISPILWLAAAVGFLALEASTFNMTSIWFAIGSAAALPVSYTHLTLPTTPYV